MSLRLGDTAPNFTADTTDGEIDFHEWLGDGWGMLMSHPADFTPVCTTELGAVGGLKEKFAKRNVKAIVVSVDSVADHKRWSSDIEETQGQAVNFPIIGDSNRQVAELYDMIHPNAGDTSTVRSVFVIDPNKKIRMTLTYPKSAGRNFNEILRVIDSLQLTDNYKVTAGELAGRRRRDRLARAVQRGSRKALPGRLERAQALPAHDQAAEQVSG